MGSVYALFVCFLKLLCMNRKCRSRAVRLDMYTRDKKRMYDAQMQNLNLRVLSAGAITL